MAFLNVKTQRIYNALDALPYVHSDDIVFVDDCLYYPLVWLIKRGYTIKSANVAHFIEDNRNYTSIEFEDHMINIKPPVGFKWEGNWTILKSRPMPSTSWDDAIKSIADDLYNLHKWISELDKQERLFS